MKKYKRYVKPVLKYIAIAFATSAFFLILLPFLFLFLSGGMAEDWKEDGTGAPHPGKLDLPASIPVFRTASGMVEEVDFEEYIKGVVAGEMPSSFEIEALKAQAVCARSYSLSKVLRGNPDAHPAAPLCDSTHCQVYRSPSDLAQIKSAEWMDTGWPKIEAAVEETRGELMYYQGHLAGQALFHSSSGGKTENAEDVFVSAVPYLRSVDSPYEEEATHQNEQTVLPISSFVSKIQKAFPSKKTGTVKAADIQVLSRSEGGRVDEIKVGAATLAGRDIRQALGLSSANFTLSVENDSVVIASNGFGHGVGMSQYGANGMAREGYDYIKILAHYYSGIEVY